MTQGTLGYCAKYHRYMQRQSYKHIKPLAVKAIMCYWSVLTVNRSPVESITQPTYSNKLRYVHL